MHLDCGNTHHGHRAHGSGTLDNIEYLTGFFAVVTALILAWAGARVLRGLPSRLERRIDADVDQRLAMMAALAQRWPHAHGGEREALARNYRFHRAAVLSLRPQQTVADIEVAAMRPRIAA